MPLISIERGKAALYINDKCYGMNLPAMNLNGRAKSLLEIFLHWISYGDFSATFIV